MVPHLSAEAGLVDVCCQCSALASDQLPLSSSNAVTKHLFEAQPPALLAKAAMHGFPATHVAW